MAKKKLKGKKPQETMGTGHPDHGKTPLAKAITRNLAQKRPAQFGGFHQIDQDLEEKEQPGPIATWKCFYLDNVLIKCIYKD